MKPSLVKAVGFFNAVQSLNHQSNLISSHSSKLLGEQEMIHEARTRADSYFRNFTLHTEQGLIAGRKPWANPRRKAKSPSGDRRAIHFRGLLHWSSGRRMIEEIGSGTADPYRRSHRVRGACRLLEPRRLGRLIFRPPNGLCVSNTRSRGSKKADPTLHKWLSTDKSHS